MQYLIHYHMMLKVASLIRQMPVGEGWVIPKEFAQWSGLSRSTVYRILPKMANQGLLIQDESYKGKKVSRAYKISQVGQEFFNSQSQLKGLE